MPDTPGPVDADGVQEPETALSHEALIYDDEDDYVANVAPFIREGLARGEPVAVLDTPRKAGLLREAVGDDGAVHHVDRSRLGDTPARQIAALHREASALAERGEGRVRLVGDIADGASDAERVEWMRYEAILNRVFGHLPRWLVCSYDRRRLPEWVTEMAGRTHRYVRAKGRRHRSDRYEEPERLVRELTPPLPEPDGAPVLDAAVGPSELAWARDALGNLARRMCSSPDRATEITIGLHEVLTNALEHGSDEARVRCWREGPRLVCEVVDEGPGLDDPFAGYRPPSADQLDGRGLWMARQTLETVEFAPPVRESGLRVVVAAAV